jgi:hypothetical protein
LILFLLGKILYTKVQIEAEREKNFTARSLRVVAIEEKARRVH